MRPYLTARLQRIQSQFPHANNTALQVFKTVRESLEMFARLYRSTTDREELIRMANWPRSWTGLIASARASSASAARRVMIAGAGVVQVLPEIAILGGACLVLPLTAARLFRWIEGGQRYKDDVSYVASYIHAWRQPLCLSAAFFLCLSD